MRVWMAFLCWCAKFVKSIISSALFHAIFSARPEHGNWELDFTRVAVWISTAICGHVISIALSIMVLNPQLSSCQNSRNWIKSYLSDKKPASLSDPATINVGTPQGAILSPTCFINLLVADRGFRSKSEVLSYAGDTC